MPVFAKSCLLWDSLSLRNLHIMIWGWQTSVTFCYYVFNMWHWSLKGEHTNSIMSLLLIVTQHWGMWAKVTNCDLQPAWFNFSNTKMEENHFLKVNKDKTEVVNISLLFNSHSVCNPFIINLLYKMSQTNTVFHSDCYPMAECTWSVRQCAILFSSLL